MRFYRVHFYDEVEGSHGFGWYTRARDAERECRRNDRDEPMGAGKVEAVDINPTKIGILRALRIYATHPDNG